ncbi:hypothetical protein FACS1894161_0570 [Spirochaetia bacterium]|nr:hypothetical protein FACS1894161_0570 [Spirochaetia bacterium]
MVLIWILLVTCRQRNKRIFTLIMHLEVMAETFCLLLYYNDVDPPYSDVLIEKAVFLEECIDELLDVADEMGLDTMRWNRNRALRSLNWPKVR